jgi:hypothetical protein
VGLTTEDLLEITTQPSRNISLLLNCTSIVSKFFDQTIKSVQDLMHRGVRMLVVDENQDLCEVSDVERVKKLIGRHPVHALERIALEAREAGTKIFAAHDLCIYDNVIPATIPSSRVVRTDGQSPPTQTSRTNSLKDFLMRVSVGRSHRDLDVVTAVASITDPESRATYLRDTAHSKLAAVLVSEHTLSSILELRSEKDIPSNLEEVLVDWICMLVCRRIATRGKPGNTNVTEEFGSKPECSAVPLPPTDLFRNFVGCDDSDNTAFVGTNSVNVRSATERISYQMRSRTGTIDYTDTPCTIQTPRFGRTQSPRSHTPGSLTPGGHNVVCTHECFPSLKFIVPCLLPGQNRDTLRACNVGTLGDDEVVYPDAVWAPASDAPMRNLQTRMVAQGTLSLVSLLSEEVVSRLANIRPESAVRIAVELLRDHMRVKCLANECLLMGGTAKVDGARNTQTAASVWQYLSQLTVLDILRGIFEDGAVLSDVTAAQQRLISCETPYLGLIAKLGQALMEDIHDDDQPHSVKLSELSCEELVILFVNSGLDECVSGLVAGALTGRALLEMFDSVARPPYGISNGLTVKFIELFGPHADVKMFCKIFQKWVKAGIQRLPVGSRISQRWYLPQGPLEL